MSTRLLATMIRVKFFVAREKNQGCSRSEKKSAERIFTERIDKPHRSVTKLDNG